VYKIWLLQFQLFQRYDWGPKKITTGCVSATTLHLEDICCGKANILHTANVCANLFFSFSQSTDILGGLKIEKRSHD